MAQRLDRQRQPARLHKRNSAKTYKRGYTAYGHKIWGQNDATYATTVTAGTPGSYGPAGRVGHASQADAIANNYPRIVPSPATAWTTGQYVQTQTPGIGGRVSWNGTAWVAGAA